MFNHQQYYDLVRFGSSDPAYSVLNIDTTFDVGRYYLTYFTYRNLSLYIKGKLSQKLYRNFREFK